MMSELSWIEIIYWTSTVIGGTLFILRTITMLIGADFDGGDADVGALDIGGDFDFHDADVGFDDHHFDTDASFKFLSLQGITAFFMMFGLVGLALLRANLPVVLTIFGGGLAGVFTVWVISMIFAGMGRLQSDGTIDIKNAVGKSGKVYLSIPANGSGQVQVSVQGSLKIFDAVSKDKEKIPTGEKIRVVDVVSSDTLIVEKLS
ncbi:hypothetical protein ACFLYP_02150 [Chloroflexota bacterium]